MNVIVIMYKIFYFNFIQLIRYVVVSNNNDYIFVTNNGKDYVLGQKSTEYENKLKYNEYEIKSSEMFNLNCIKLKGEKIPFNKDVVITFLLEYREKTDNNSKLVLIKIGSNEFYFMNDDVILEEDKSKEKEVELKKENSTLYRIAFLKDIYESIEISSNNNIGIDNECYLSELRVYEKNELFNNYIFTLPLIGKDLINTKDMYIEIIDDIIINKCNTDRNRILKESENIYNYDNMYYINQREIEMDNKNKRCKIRIEVEMVKEWEEIEFVLTVYIYIYY